ncbi:MAG TPA: hypothetical protein VL326_04370 [Kofleriaceae bacterium]|nr:hypothetical protein [Kofleriaceae bacterium]
MQEVRPILVVHPEAKVQRMVRRIVGGTFRPIIVVDSAAAAAERCKQSAPFLAIVEHQLLRETAPALPADAQTLVLMQDGDSGDLGLLLERANLSFLLANPMPLLAEELSTTVQKLSRHDIFGLEKYLTWGVEIRELVLADAQQRRALVHELADDVERACLGPRPVAAASLIADELLSNAVFNAPVDAKGDHVHAKDTRTDSRALADRDLVTLRYACDARYLAIEVNDHYGSLDHATILRCLTKASSRGTKVSMTTRGAGIGLATVFGSCNHLVFNLDPSKRTQVIALIDVRFRPIELGNTLCSFGIFKTEGP